jgi:hypothetical protein
MKKILLASVMTALALPVIAAETTTITTSSPEAMTTTTVTTQQVDRAEPAAQREEAAPTIQKEEEVLMEKEEAVVPAAGATTAPAVDALPETGGGFKQQQPLDQQRMEDPASDQPAGGPHRMDDPTIEDESGEYAPKIDDVDSMEDYD